MGYKSSYIVQQPIASYPVKSSYQYIPASPYGSYATPVQRIAYSAVPYNYAPKSIYAPGARLIASPGSWNDQLSLLKKR